MKKETQYFTANQNDLEKAALILRNEGTVIFPTETVYGLGADARNPEAVAKIFTAKGRPSDNPLIVHIAKEEQLYDLVAEVPEKAKKLMKAFWPGPLTLIFNKAEWVPKAVTGGLSTVGVRMPKEPIAHALLELSGIPVAAPSANLSGKPSPTAFSHVKEDMDGRVDAIIDGGNCRVGVESTVLDISGAIPVLYRPGGITREQLEAEIGEVQVVTKAKEGEAPKSPGLKYKHYAPKAEVRILKGTFDQAVRYGEKLSKKGKTAFLTFDEFPKLPAPLVTYSLGSRNLPEEAANRLFYALRELDHQEVSYILAPEIPDTGVWSAVKNRLYRAAGERVYDVSGGVQSVLFVCTGNTCRSPMAEGIFRKLAEENAKGIEVSSAGLFAGSSPASDHAIQVMQEKGIDISTHQSRQLTEQMMADADLILTMTESHRAMLLLNFPEYGEKVDTLSGWAGESEEVSDPYGGDTEIYRRTADQIEDYLQKGWAMHL